MSRQSKAAKRKIVAKQFTELHKAGQRGPSKTKPLHGKVNVEWKIRARVLQSKIEDEAKAAKQKQDKEAKLARQAEAKLKADRQPKAAPKFKVRNSD